VKSSKYLDALIDQEGLKNDRALAAFLEVGTNTISQWRSGARSMDHEMCLKVALALHMDNPMPIIMAADMDRAERAGQRSLWEVFSPRMASSAAATLLIALAAGVTNFVTPSPAEAAPLSHSEGRPLCIMLNNGSPASAGSCAPTTPSSKTPA